MKQPRVKVDAHVILWRGLLLIYGCMVFGDTSESVDEVLVRAFFFCLHFRDSGLLSLKRINCNLNLEFMQKIISGIIILVIMYCVFNCGDNKSDYAGTYTTTDAVGTKLKFILSEDGNVKCIEEWKSIYGIANSYSENNEFGNYRQTDTKTHYGRWEYLSNAIPCEITISDGPIIYFNTSNNSDCGYKYQIKNGYLYTDIDDCKASHPNRRLKLTKQ